MLHIATESLAKLYIGHRRSYLRLDSSVCDELDSIGRQCWRDWEKEQHQSRKKALKRANSDNLTGNLRSVKRSASESLEVERRHQQIVSEY